MRKPFRIAYTGQMLQTMEELRSNVVGNQHLPKVEKGTARGRLAVAGGGPSLARNLERLREFDAVWAINRTPRFLHGHGIRSTLFTVDAMRSTAERYAENDSPDLFSPAEFCDGAIFASSCAPSVVAQYPQARVFDFAPIVEGGLCGGSTSAGCAPMVAAFMGFSSITWFGCEGSWSSTSHAYESEHDPYQLVVRANEQLFRTSPSMLLQAQELAMMLDVAPDFFHEESGGLLRALHRDPEGWEIVAVSDRVAEGVFGERVRELPRFYPSTVELGA